MKILNADPGLLSQQAEVPDENKGIEQERNAAGVCVCVCVCVCVNGGGLHMWMEPATLAEVPFLLPWSFNLSFYRAGEYSYPFLLFSR